MAKNRTMRVAILMLALTLVTTCFVGGTFAKYTTGLTIGGSAYDSGDDGANDGSSARVAKFGVEITANGAGDGTGTGDADGAISLFKKEYENGAGEVIVKSTDYVVAPGTSNSSSTADGSADADASSLFGLTITGTPEVAVNVKYDATVSLGSGASGDTTNTSATNGTWEVDGEYYCPLIFTINGVAYNGNDYDSLVDFEAALTESIEVDENFAPGTDLSTALVETLGDGTTTINKAEFDISWEWPFEGAAGSEQTDEKDTALADAAAAAIAGGTADAATAFNFDFEVTATVTQINENVPTV